MKKPIKLRQAQVWKQGAEYFRIVRLERLEVEYQSTTSMIAKKGAHHTVSKKEFCRLIKHAELQESVKHSPGNEADASAPVQ